DLPVDLRRVDRVAGIGRTDDAVDFDLVAARHRDFGRGGDVAAVAHLLGEAAIDALRRRLVPADFLRHCVEHGEMLGMLAHQLAPELERILPGCVRQLIHEAFEIDGVLVVVHATPEVRRDVRVAYGVVNQQVRDRVAELPLRPAWVEVRNTKGSLPSCRFCGLTKARIDWPEMRMCSTVKLLLASNAPTIFAWVTGW